MQLDAEQLLLAINQGQELSAEQVSELVDVLLLHLEKNCLNVDDVYSYISVLLKLQNTAYLDILERYLTLEDPLLASLILESLCLEWELADQFSTLVVNGIHGLSWDTDEDIRESAIRIAGVLAEGEKLELSPTSVLLLKALFDVSESANEDTFIRRACYRSLLRAALVAKEEIPNEFQQFSLEADSDAIDREALEKLRYRIAVKKNSSENTSRCSSQTSGEGSSEYQS